MVRQELLTVRVNGRPRTIAAPHLATLLDLLREDLGLTGTKRGCDDASCGACTVLVDGRPRLACTSLALEAADREVTTIEGACRDPRTAALQRFLAERGGVQCGFCTPGIVLAAHALFATCPRPDENAIRAGLAGNLCRCTGWVGIVDALVHAGSATATGRRGDEAESS